MVTDDRPFLGDTFSDYHSFPLLSIFNSIVVVCVSVLMALFLAFVSFRRELHYKQKHIAQKTWSIMYMTLLGVGFIGFEVILIQKFGLLFGNPTYSVGFVLAIILFFGGIGSLLVKKFDIQNPIMIIAPVGVILFSLCFMEFYLDTLIGYLLVTTIVIRSLFVLIVVAIPSLGLGMLFPLGLLVAGSYSKKMIPLLWGANGVGAVIGGLGAELLTHQLGFSLSFLVLSAIYVAILFCYQLLFPKNIFFDIRCMITNSITKFTNRS